MQVTLGADGKIEARVKAEEVDDGPDGCINVDDLPDYCYIDDSIDDD